MRFAIEPIADRIKKRNAKHKRSKIIMKKAYELSVLCQLEVNVSFFDREKNKVIEFASNPDFTLKNLSELIAEDARNGILGKKFVEKLYTSRDFMDQRTGKFSSF